MLISIYHRKIEDLRNQIDLMSDQLGRKGRKDSSIDYTALYNKGAREALKLAKMFNVTKAYLLLDCPMCGRKYGILARLLTKNGILIHDIP